MLSLTEKFERDIQQNHSTVYPLIIIDDTYYISTIEEIIISENEPLKFKDYGLKISNIKESIDVQSHSFKISNVTLTLNNYEQDGLRLSDVLSDKANKYVNVYYKTQSCKKLKDCLLTYRGVIKRSSHNDSKLSLTLEDLTDTKLHKEVPIANLGYSDKAFNKEYINRPIPITYGEVEKAPVIPWLDKDIYGRSVISIIADDVEEVTGSGRGILIDNFGTNNEKPELNFESELNNDSPLYIYKDDYFRVLREYNSGVDIGNEALYTQLEQYNIDDTRQFIGIDKKFLGGFPQNPPASNEFQTVKILRPNQSELLYSEGGDPEYGEDSSIINIQPDGGILRPEAAIDSSENPTVFFNKDMQSEFTTFAQVPNNQSTQENSEIENGNLIVNLFTNYNESNSRKGILYPTTNWSNPDGNPAKINYLWLINAWIQTNAHYLNVKFISAPSGDMVVTAADDWLLNNGYRPHPTDMYNDTQTWEEAGYPNTQIFDCKTGGEKVGIYNQYALSEGFKSAWINACDGVEGNETDTHYVFIEDYYHDDAHYNEFYTHEYYPEDVSKTLHPFLSQFNPAEATDRFYNNSHIFGNPDKQAIYPTTVYKITCNTSFEYNNPNTRNNDLSMPIPAFRNTPSNRSGAISTVYVGQWNENTMAGALQEDELWINLFDDGSERPFLFNQNDFATFKPTTLKDKHKDNNVEYVIGTKYEAEYNGVDINTQNGTSFNQAATDIKHEYFAGGYGHYTEANNKIYMDGLCGYNNDTGGTSGGQSWWMLIEEPIDRNVVLSNLSEQDGEYYDEFIDMGCNTSIQAGTLIPCGGKVNHQHSGQNFNYDYSYIKNPNYVNLTMGSSTVSEQRLSLFFPMSDIASSDSVETSSFVYGKIKLSIPSEEGNNITHKTSVNDSILLQAYATTKVNDDLVNYNSDFVGGNQYATNLISLDGGDDIFTEGGEVHWDCNNPNIGTDIINQFNDFKNFRISDWDSPDAFDSLALVYRIRSDNPNTDHRVHLSTDISSIALLQYTVFENVFKDDLYADIKGRLDEEGIYTNQDLLLEQDIRIDIRNLIENPADVLYHFVEKELEAVNITNRKSWEIASSENKDIKLAFSVKEKIDSKKLITDISKNTRLFPKFNSSGEFSYSSIKNEYGNQDEEIRQDDIISFEFTRTPSENIHTLVNVKYKKDYAEDEYRRETGYCDGYDFFGNSENGAEVYKKDGNGNYQWDSNGYNYSFLGLNREDNILEFESDFIRDYESAVNLRNYIYLLNCNQHTIVKCTLPLKYIKLEVGDVVKFDKLNNGVKAFGEDYTKENVRNGQIIYPFFIITSLTKSSNNIKVECMQLHKLKANFSAGQGSLSRRSELGTAAFEDIVDIAPNEHITLADIDILEDIIAGIYTNYITSKQKISADLSNDGSIDQLDLNTLEVLFNSTSEDTGIDEEQDFTLGDLNQDGIVNVTDVTNLINYLTMNSLELSESQLLAADIDEDGIVSITDVMLLIDKALD